MGIKIRIIADLHIHGRYSQATSKSLDFANLEKYARIKGIGLLGTGDFTHPKWIEEIRNSLKDDGTGILRSRTGFPFVLQTEISLVYSQGGRGRRIHNIVLAPGLDTVSRITDYLLSKGRVDYDGRPIFSIPCPDFIGSLRKISPDIEVIPAHIWTPWFSLFGSKSGFDSVTECFREQAEHVHAIETGLSSDPPMNWRLSQLDSMNILSFSDLHSYWPWRIGREATIFNAEELTYAGLLRAIRTGAGLEGTIEVDPNYGKYHFDGHRNCNVVMSPKDSARHRKICPVCKKEMTIGVLSRVEELADREEGFVPENAKSFISLIPLSEIISIIRQKPVASKSVWEEYSRLVHGTNELDVLMSSHPDYIAEKSCRKLADAVMLMRDGKARILPGYDGVYGKPEFTAAGANENEPQKGAAPEMPGHVPQKALNDFF